MPAAFSEYAVEMGAAIRVETPAGAGYGDPFEREPRRVLADVVAEKVSPEAARRDYGVVIVDGQVDEEATRALRERPRQTGETGGGHAL
jgi:N-methylhydantoinase B